MSNTLRSGAHSFHPADSSGFVFEFFSELWFLASSGRNDKGQLGHGDTKRLEAPKLIEALADHVIVAAACGRNHTLALTGRLSHAVFLFSQSQQLIQSRLR